MAFPIVFMDIAGENVDVLHRFYSDVFGWTTAEGEPDRLPISAPLAWHLRQDPAEMRFYIGVPDVSAHLRRIQNCGGRIEAERFEVQGVAVIGLFRDPAGNPLGLVEMEGDQPRIP